jgi:integrase
MRPIRQGSSGARHTAATTLLLLGIPERAVMDVMGWSNAAMVKRYAHVTARLQRDIADPAERVPLGVK